MLRILFLSPSRCWVARVAVSVGSFVVTPFAFEVIVNLVERASTIRSREDLVPFLEALSADFAASRATWANGDLASFLEAMAAWSQDMEGYYQNRGERIALVSPWRVLADILMAARVYE